jgi:hypothetical protein
MPARHASAGAPGRDRACRNSAGTPGGPRNARPRSTAPTVRLSGPRDRAEYPGVFMAFIAAKRRNKSNPWFKRGTLTTSRFSPDAMHYKSSRYDLHLRDYEGIVEWINAYRSLPTGKLHIENNRLILPDSLKQRS